MKQYILRYKIILQLFQYAQKAIHPLPASVHLNYIGPPLSFHSPTPGNRILSVRQLVCADTTFRRTTLTSSISLVKAGSDLAGMKHTLIFRTLFKLHFFGGNLQLKFIYDTSVFTNMVLKSLFIWCQFLINQLYHCGTSCLRLDSQPHFCFVLFGLSFPCEFEFAVSLQKVWRTIPVLRNSIEQPSKGSLNLWVGWRLKEKCSLP